MPLYTDLLSEARAPSLRERLLAKQLDRADTALRHYGTVLQDPSASGLYPGEADVFRRNFELLQRQRAAVANEMQIVRRQNADITKGVPLRPSKERDGFTRSQSDRNAAILGILERERRRVAPLSRSDYDSAKATAARSSKYDLYRAYRASGHLYPSIASLQGVDLQVPSVDPCVEYERVQRNRREVMFARGLITGYRTKKKFRSPC